MPDTQESLLQLAEAVSPLSHSLAAGLLVRPVLSAVRSEQTNFNELCTALDATHKDCVSVMTQSMAALEHCPPDELEELVDELATAALDLVDMARRIWESPLPPEAEEIRSLLATLAEAPATQLLQWILEVMHCIIDPWSVADDPENPDVSYTLRVPDAPLREALRRWREKHPNLIPDDVLR